MPYLKRHPALVPLSHEHRECLIVAQMLKGEKSDDKDIPTDTKGKKDYALEFFDHVLTPHQKAEEEVLFPLIRTVTNDFDDLMLSLAEDHVKLTKMMNELEISDDLDSAMKEIGELLYKHVRSEEKDFFDKFQDTSLEETLLLLHFPHTESR